MHDIIVMWGVPRSVSTAFDRMMRERGDHEVFFEPFSAHYYFSEDRSSDRFDDDVDPGPEHDFDAILEHLRETARDRPVFVKEMAYHVADRADEDFLDGFVNTFITRHPGLALPSLAKIWPDFTLEEAGYEPQLELFEQVTELTGSPPPVIDGEDLRADPERVVESWSDAVGIPFDPDALEWEPERPADWETWQPWVGGVERSSGFKPPDADVAEDELVPDDPRLRKAYEACLPAYEQLAAHLL